jgi:hypothetical protein
MAGEATILSGYRFSGLRLYVITKTDESQTTYSVSNEPF